MIGALLLAGLGRVVAADDAALTSADSTLAVRSSGEAGQLAVGGANGHSGEGVLGAFGGVTALLHADRHSRFGRRDVAQPEVKEES